MGEVCPRFSACHTALESQIQASLSPKVPGKARKSLAQPEGNWQVHLYGTPTQDWFIQDQEIREGGIREPEGGAWVQTHLLSEAPPPPVLSNTTVSASREQDICFGCKSCPPSFRWHLRPSWPCSGWGWVENWHQSPWKRSLIIYSLRPTPECSRPSLPPCLCLLCTLDGRQPLQRLTALWG